MEENMQEILDRLLPALQATQRLHRLEKLEYVSKSPISQYVRATFANGYKKRIGVTMDSGIAMIRDVIEQVV